MVALIRSSQQASSLSHLLRYEEQEYGHQKGRVEPPSQLFTPRCSETQLDFQIVVFPSSFVMRHFLKISSPKYSAIQAANLTVHILLKESS